MDQGEVLEVEVEVDFQGEVLEAVVGLEVVVVVLAVVLVSEEGLVLDEVEEQVEGLGVSSSTCDN